MHLRISLILLVALVLGGAATVGCHTVTKVPVMPRVSPSLIDVGGLVQRPGPLEIPTEGLTLAQAIVRAGDVLNEVISERNRERKSFLEKSAEDLVKNEQAPPAPPAVAPVKVNVLPDINRNAATLELPPPTPEVIAPGPAQPSTARTQVKEPSKEEVKAIDGIEWLKTEIFVVVYRGRTKLHFELDLVREEGAGLMQLVRGDVVRVVRGDELPIALQGEEGRHPVESNAFGITGISPLADREITIRREGNRVPTKSLEQYLGDFHVKAADVIDGNQSTVVVLTRHDLPHAIMQEVYVLPILRSPVGQAVVPLPGDQFDFTRLEAIPSVMTGLIAPQLYAQLRSAEKQAALLGSLPDRSQLPIFGPLVNLYRCASEKMHTSRVEPYPTEIPLPSYGAAIKP